MLVSRWFAAVWAVALCAGLMGCGSSEGDEGGDGDAKPTGDPTLQIYFPKLYTAFVPGSQQIFQVPAVVAGVKPDKWTCSDPSAVSFAEDQIDNGVMITAKKAGKFKITAISGKQYGVVDIEITASTPEQLKAGEDRYNNEVALDLRGLVNPMTGGMVSNNASCKNCHGNGAMYLAVEHTPQQTGGYSDDDLKKIFSMGMKPPGAQFGTFPGIAMYYPIFHKWAGNDDEYQGLIVYLRSLQPQAQGELDFMGLIAGFRAMRMMGGGAAGGAAPAGTAGAAP